MTRQPFDQLDRRILAMLSTNARRPLLEIARECGVSGAAVHQRVQRLLEKGIIQRYECIVDPETMGYNACAYMGLTFRDPSHFDEVIEALKGIPEVVECHFTTGPYDAFIKVMARDNDHLLHIIHHKMQQLGLMRTESLVSFQEVFRRPLPVPQLDDTEAKEDDAPATADAVCDTIL